MRHLREDLGLGDCVYFAGTILRPPVETSPLSTPPPMPCFSQSAGGIGLPVLEAALQRVPLLAPLPRAWEVWLQRAPDSFRRQPADSRQGAPSSTFCRARPPGSGAVSWRNSPGVGGRGNGSWRRWTCPSVPPKISLTMGPPPCTFPALFRLWPKFVKSPEHAFAAGIKIHRRGLGKKQGGVGRHVTAMIPRTFSPNLKKKNMLRPRTRSHRAGQVHGPGAENHGEERHLSDPQEGRHRRITASIPYLT